MQFTQDHTAHKGENQDSKATLSNTVLYCLPKMKDHNMGRT